MNHDWVYANPVKHPPGSISIWRGHRRRCSSCRTIEYLMGTSCGGMRFWSEWPELENPPAWPRGGTTRKEPNVQLSAFIEYKSYCAGKKPK